MIRRSARRTTYTIVDNAAITDDRLSFRALGLLAYLLSKPDHWTVNREHLASTHQEGQSAVRSALQELEKAGYLRRERGNDTGTGKLGWQHVVYETPSVGNPPMDNPPVVEPPVVIAPPSNEGGSEAGGSNAGTDQQAATPNRACRIPEPFIITPAMWVWAHDELNMEPDDARTITREFVDYWRGASGANARKHDWTATWRNWLRRASRDRRTAAPNRTRPTRHAGLYQEDE